MSTTPAPRFWCHPCGTEIDALIAPDPTCPICHSNFVEEVHAKNHPIDENDHPRDFSHELLDDEGEEDPEDWGLSPELVEDTDMTNGADGADGDIPGATRGGQDQEALHLLQTLLQNAMGQNGTITIQTVPLRNAAGGTPAVAGGALGGGATGAARDRDGQQVAGDPQMPLLSFLQQAFNIGPIGPGGQGGPGGGLFNQFFNMVGNPNDYVFSQAGLDNIVSQLMEQAAA
ncbi:hypothetical protein BC937DRAFT_93224 [Endogone sp. FLAS-F59071]|nr:hypothetical protein BC937DRAFT_93224 [Endogone sp. FLAS-F59071]|eukprot:RUS14860.1 hypothetical protein BC937DRAFT_93224 [Endogone sp. FLAS-F59071]